VERKRIRYTGRVQGVGFRATTHATASGFAVTGWVRNEPDGSVLVEAQGTRDAVEAFIDAVGSKMDRFIASATEDALPVLVSEQGSDIRH